ncbi:hypothetical protein M8J75_007908 [Diaphorina citri]|nr:hypothetical protein M8J75_007908 [Diaphorina citri]
MVNNDSITIMQKIEELKQWQKQHESKVTSPNALASPTTDKQQGRAPQNGNDMFNFSSPSMRLKPPDNLNIKSDILNLDNGIHMIDELLNRIQRKSNEPQPDVVHKNPLFHSSSPLHNSHPYTTNQNPTHPYTANQNTPSLPRSYEPQEAHPNTQPESYRFTQNTQSDNHLLSQQIQPELFRDPNPTYPKAHQSQNTGYLGNHQENFNLANQNTQSDRSTNQNIQSIGKESTLGYPERDSEAHLLDTFQGQMHQNGQTYQDGQTHQDGHTPGNGLQSEDRPKAKKPFLRRGEGLTRFRMTLNDFKKPVPKPTFVMTTRPVAVPDKRPSNTDTARPNITSRPTIPSRPDLMTKAALTHLATWSNVFENDKPSPQDVAMSPLSLHRTQAASELERRKKKENEEQKVFELLEQKTKDASFSSTSSMVAKLMEESVRSTPVKRHPATLGQEPPTTEHGSSSGRTDKGSHVRFTDANLYRTIEEVDESVQTSGEVYGECGDSSIDSTRLDDRTGFTIQPLPSHVHTERDMECECDSESDTQYCSSEDEGEQTPSVDEAIKSYKPVLNRPYVDSGKTSALTYSQLEEYLKLSAPLQSLPSNKMAASKMTTDSKMASKPQTNHNQVVKETKRLLEEIKKLQEEKEREEREEDKENNRNRGNGGGRKQNGGGGGGFPMTVYQETYQKHGGKTRDVKKSTGLKSFGADNPDPNPFEYHSETAHSLELLKKRLGDLENEIHVFRLENIKLNKERKEFEKDRAAFTRSKKTAEKALQEEKDAFTREMDEERSKLNREKKVFLKYAKDAKNFPSKQEREDLSRLKAELQGLKEDAVKKETKWAASQARLRNHIKVLEAQNAELKVSFSSKKHISNTQIMNAINSQISKLTKSDLPPPNAKPPTSILKKTSHPSTTHNPNTHSISPSSKNTHSNSPSSQANQSNSPGSKSNSSNQSNAPNFSLGSSHYSVDSAPSSYNLRGGEKGEELMPEDSFDRVIYQSLLGGERVGERKEEEPSRDDDVIPIHTLNLGAPHTTSTNTTTASDAEYKEIITADGTRERHYTDGRQEIHYPNGNTVIVSEAGKYIKMFYYNGDIKETDTGDRTVRYFYSESNTWHTTMPDGTEVLEFANGQKERRLTDGRVEIEYTNGCRRVIGKDGNEVWRFEDGPVETVEILGDQRILKLRNGQKEIHTREYKRREFPDGAVKLVYPDGIQETRYPNGRIRLKDDQGNLIMDSHEM